MKNDTVITIGYVGGLVFVLLGLLTLLAMSYTTVAFLILGGIGTMINTRIYQKYCTYDKVMREDHEV